MRKIFALMVFVYGIILSVTAFADPPNYPKSIVTKDFGALFIGTDGNENGWYVNPTKIETIKQDADELIFTGSFLIMYNDAERAKTIQNFRNEGKNMPDNLELQFLGFRFKEANGIRYYAMTDNYFLDSDKQRIDGFGFVNGNNDWDKINSGSILDDLFEVSKGYLEN